MSKGWEMSSAYQAGFIVHESIVKWDCLHSRVKFGGDIFEREVCSRVTFFRQLGTIAIWLHRDVNIDPVLTWKQSIIRPFQVSI